MSTTLQATPAADAYLTAFNDLEAELTRISRPAVQQLREAAIARFGEIGFPSSRNEDWKFTNLAPLLRTSFFLPPADSQQSAESYRRILPQDNPSLPEGVLVMSLAEALQRHPELVERHRAGDLPRAREVYLQLVADNPQEAILHNLLAALCIDAGQPDEAAPHDRGRSRRRCKAPARRSDRVRPLRHGRGDPRLCAARSLECAS